MLEREASVTRKSAIWADREGGTVLPEVAATIERLNADGASDKAIGEALAVSEKVVQRARKALGLEKPAKHPGGREALLTVEMSAEQLELAKGYAKAARYTTTSPWVRDVLLKGPRLASQARAGDETALTQLLSMLAGPASSDEPKPKEPR